jgi:glycosyltransferase involved in cell wall biosynthesis
MTAMPPVTPRLSIIVATMQAAATLDRCINSIIDQDFTDWELLIADGASTDGTTDLIRRYEERVTWWRSADDAGIYDAWNHALVHAHGEYVCFLGADDAWIDSGALTRLFTAIGAREYDLVTSRGLICDSSSGISFDYGSAWNYKRIGRHMLVCHPGLLHRRSLFDDHGLFDIRYRIAGDLDFLLRLPPDLRTLHVDTKSVFIDATGLSRKNVLARLREQREVLARCERFGPLRAYLAWTDKLLRFPIARLLKIPH